DCTNEMNISTGTFSCLKAQFQMQRQLGSYLVGTYVPTILIVMTSWLSFWISMDAVAARVSLELLNLIAIITKNSEVAANLPRVSYIKALDIWNNACIIFIIAAMLEFGIAVHWSRKMQYYRWRSEVRKLVRQELARTMCPCPYVPANQSPHPTPSFLLCQNRNFSSHMPINE
ncbi:hypothetical protein Ciccas_014108, partial [Cichlidogyrus casuarinus]